MVNKNYHKFCYISKNFLANFGVIWTTKSLANNLKTKDNLENQQMEGSN
jgi:hypothetical protein